MRRFFTLTGVTIVLILSTGTAEAQVPRLVFKTYPLGTDGKTFFKLNPSIGTQRPTKIELETNTRVFDFYQALIPEVTCQQTFYFIGDSKKNFTLCEVDMQFDSTHYSSVYNAFCSKYGPPTKKDTEKVKNVLGVEFEVVTSHWAGVVDSIVLISMAGTTDRSYASFYNVKAAKERSARIAAHAAKSL